MKKLLGIVITAALVAGCEDKAKSWFDDAQVYEQRGDLGEARRKYEIATEKDPTSEFGKRAAERLKEIEPAYLAPKAKKEAEAAERAQAEAEAQAAAIERLRRKVRRTYESAEPDSLCTGKGLPPYRWEYAGGPFAEDQVVAHADGCRAPFTHAENTAFCCPRKPNAW